MLIKKAERKPVEENPYDWPESYYMETRPEQRLALLEAQSDPDQEAENALRRRLWELRYEKQRNGQMKDRFLGAWLDLMLLQPQADSRFGRKKARSQAVKALEQLALTQTETFGRELLLAEVKHTILVYCCTSMEDRQYGSVIFGLGKMKKETISKKIDAELCNTGIWLPKKLELEKEAALLTEAVELARLHMGFS